MIKSEHSESFCEIKGIIFVLGARVLPVQDWIDLNGALGSLNAISFCLKHVPIGRVHQPRIMSQNVNGILLFQRGAHDRFRLQIHALVIHVQQIEVGLGGQNRAPFNRVDILVGQVNSVSADHVQEFAKLAYGGSVARYGQICIKNGPLFGLKVVHFNRFTIVQSLCLNLAKQVLLRFNSDSTGHNRQFARWVFGAGCQTRKVFSSLLRHLRMR